MDKRYYYIMRPELYNRIKNMISQVEPGSLIIIDGASMTLRNRDVEYRFYQTSAFFYLTEWLAPNARLLIDIKDRDVESILFYEEVDPEKQKWIGICPSYDAIVSKGHATTVYTLDRYEQIFQERLAATQHVYFEFSDAEKYQSRINHSLKQMMNQRVHRESPGMHDLDTLLGRLRLEKSDYEIERMRHAASISAKGHIDLMEKAKSGLFEYQLGAEFERFCRYHGCDHLAYESIIASGKNACILHYTQCQDQLHDNDMVLIDAGGEYAGYAADITRSFPVSGRFTAAQKDIYEVVLAAQTAVIKAIKPGLEFKSLQTIAREALFDGLKGLGIMKKWRMEQLQHFYFHGVSHWLGLDVHDGCPYLSETGQSIKLAPGMTLTVEPGLYFSSHLDELSPEFHHLGIRIEDDILVTQDGAEILTIECPKTINAIEEVMLS